MSREFTMGIRLNYMDNSFSRGIKDATRNTNGFRDSMRGAQTSADGLIGKLGGLAVAFGGIAAGKKAFSWLVGANADMETYQNTLTVVMGSQEQAVKTLDWATKFAAKTPFEIPQVVEATTRMSAYGINAQKTLGIVGDMASVMGKDLLQAVEAVADAQTGEMERLKEFGITKAMISKQAQALGANPIDNKGSITDVKAFNAALFSLMEKRFKGGMDMASKSYKGMLSNAKDFIGSLGRQLGKPLFDRAKADLEGFLNTVNLLQANGSIDRFVANVHKAGAVVGNEFAYWGGLAKKGFGAIWKASAPVFDFIRQNWADIKPFVEGVAIAIGAVVGAMALMKTYTLAATIAMRLLSAAMLTNPIGWIILAVGLLVGWFIKMNGGIEGSKKKLLEMWNVAKKFGQAIADIFTKADPTRLMDMGFSREFVGAVWKVVTGARFMADQLVKGWAWIQQQAAKYWPPIQAVAMVVIHDMVSAFKWLQAAAIKYWPAIQTAILNVWNNVKTTVLPAIMKLLTVAVTAFKQIWAVVLPLGAAIYNFFKAIAPTVLTLVAIIAWAVVNILWPVALQIWKVLLSVAAAVIPVVVNIVTSIVSGFTAVLKWFAVIWPAIQKIVMFAFGVIMFLWAALGPYIMAILSVIGSIITGGFQVIMAVVQFVWTTISSIIQIAWAVISGLIQTALGLLTGDWEMAWNGIKSVFEGIWNGIIKFLGGLGSLFYDSGKAIITTLIDGIKSMAMAPVNAVKNILGKVRDLLPFSDAKKGPLSELTYSGGAVMTTLAKGVYKQQGVLQDAVSNAFAGTSLGMNVSATATAPQMAPGGSFSAAGTNIAPTQVKAVAAPPAKTGGDINVASLVGKIDIQAQPGDNADDLFDQFIDRLYTRAKEVAAILSSADKGELV